VKTNWNFFFASYDGLYRAGIWRCPYSGTILKAELSGFADG
jgi:hypothetical protein